MRVDPSDAGLILGIGVSLVLIFFFAGLGAHDLSAPDEPRFALVAQEMLSSGHWVLPHRNDQPYPDKPPLLFWLIAGFSALIADGSVNAWSARLPSALSAAWVVGLLWYWVNQTHGSRLQANLSALVLMSSFLFFFEARMAQIDMLLCALTSTAVIVGHRALTGSRHHSVILGAALGLAVLAKGPVGYVVPAGALGLFVLFRGRGTWRRYPWQALIWGLLPVIAWLAVLVSVVAAGGQWDYFVNLVFKQTITRAFNPWHHHKPFFYFGLTLLHDFLPWTPLLLLSLPWTRAQRRILRDPQKLAWAVVLFTLLFFSLSKGKRNIYILPLFPFAAYLTAIRISELFTPIPWSRMEKAATLLAPVALGIGGIGLAALAAGLIPLDVTGIPDPPPLLPLGLWGLLVMICGAVGAIGVWRSNGWRYVSGVVGGMAAIVLAAYTTVFPWIGPYRSGRHFMEQATAIIEAESRRPVVGMIQYRSAFRLYGDHPIVELASEFGTPNPDLPKPMDFWRNHPNGWIIATEEYWLPTRTLHPIPHRIRYREQIGQRQPVLLIRLYSSLEEAQHLE